ncbi:helix-turn-helix transcriptional regulator [Pontibacillus litoralis]|uniref:HTH cro/C1-type domain-containing protein n=1 Tax=Pontibacillus litoralis JSM 072002 TaxID=1385512 RepID=A0A0A5HN73_9BACI|nr:helix-turn-helix transcriptional regulator [Pontibacillus litoralis]KGX85057.1 hypothetical protein N784_11215 [Pontibacillus litoralis JSM 072002]
MDIGSRIKFHRLNKGMTQEELASGIISKSYLSKIENDQSIPAQEIIHILCERLEMSYEEDEHESLFEVINDWFELLLKGKRLEAVKAYNQIEKQVSNVSNSRLTKLYEIHKIRFFVITQEAEKAKKQMLNLTSFYTSFTLLEKYYFHKFSGDFYYSTCVYETSLEHYREAEKHLDSKILLYHQEKNDLYYLLSLTAIQLWKYHLCIFYAEKALSYYQDMYNLFRCAQCHITIGIAYKRMGELDKAIESYDKAFQIAEVITNKTLLANCHQNLGSLFFERGDIDKAIEQYIKSFEVKEESAPHKKLFTIVGLVKLYYQEGRMKDAKDWIQRGEDLLRQIKTLDAVVSLNLRLYKFLVYDPDERFETFMVEEAIPMLKEKKLTKEISYYYQMLADYYYMDRKYKNACIYYQKAHQNNQFQSN